MSRINEIIKNRPKPLIDPRHKEPIFIDINDINVKYYLLDSQGNESYQR